MKQPIIAFIASALLLTACMSTVTERKRLPLSAANITQIQDKARHNLRDPDSAKFRNIRRIQNTHEDGSTTTLVCGEINGKNAFGAYVGYRTFKGNLTGNTFRLHGIGDSDNNWLYVATCPV